MQFAVVRSLFVAAVLAEDREQEDAVMESAVLDGVVQLRDTAGVELLLFDVAEVLEELLPAFAE